MASTFGQLLSLAFLFLFVGGAVFVGYHIWASVGKIQQSAADRMARKNVVFTKDGMRVGVKHVEQERYVDATQSWFVKAWNMAAPAPMATTTPSSSSSSKSTAAKRR
ncbi:uncharacterized protein PG998_005527 [Apiospora kogelbergensis]|uniref:Uncharacterized protein n=1 Tax=Apiospora kogelbergensis TaxID=1337665 RepID=A0AAW0QBM9_9PEZI